MREATHDVVCLRPEADFARVKPRMVRVGDVKTFENFIVPMPASIDPARRSPPSRYRQSAQRSRVQC